MGKDKAWPRQRELSALGIAAEQKGEGNMMRMEINNKRAIHTLVLELAGASRLILKLLTKLVQQLRQAGVGSRNHPAIRVHGARLGW